MGLEFGMESIKQGWVSWDKGSMTSDSSYVIMVPSKGDLLTRRPTGIDDFRCGIAYQGHHLYHLDNDNKITALTTCAQ
jgi:hypothetical protein